MKVLAAGASGQFAHRIVPALTARGVDVRAMIHTPAKADVARRYGATEISHADLVDKTSLRRAMEGVDGVFLITPAFHPDATQMGLNMVRAAIASDVTKVVYNGVYHPSLSLINHAGTRPIEEALYRSDLDFTILEPAMYMQGLANTYYQALRTGRVVMPWSKWSKMTYVDYRDVAQVAAIAFTSDRLAHGTFELAADGMTDRNQVAELMSRAAARELVAADVETAQRVDVSDGLRAMFTDYDRFGFHGGNSLVLRTILGREPCSLSDYIFELAEAPEAP